MDPQLFAVRIFAALTIRRSSTNEVNSCWECGVDLGDAVFCPSCDPDKDDEDEDDED